MATSTVTAWLFYPNGGYNYGWNTLAAEPSTDWITEKQIKFTISTSGSSITISVDNTENLFCYQSLDSSASSEIQFWGYDNNGTKISKIGYFSTTANYSTAMSMSSTITATLDSSITHIRIYCDNGPDSFRWEAYAPYLSLVSLQDSYSYYEYSVGWYEGGRQYSDVWENDCLVGDGTYSTRFINIPLPGWESEVLVASESYDFTYSCFSCYSGYHSNPYSIYGRAYIYVYAPVTYSQQTPYITTNTQLRIEVEIEDGHGGSSQVDESSVITTFGSLTLNESNAYYADGASNYTQKFNVSYQSSYGKTLTTSFESEYEDPYYSGNFSVTIPDEYFSSSGGGSSGDDTTTNSNPTTVPAPTYPLKFSIGETITISWKPSTDPDGDTLTYRMIGYRNNESSPSIRLNAGTATSVTYTVPAGTTSLWFYGNVSDGRGGSASGYAGLLATLRTVGIQGQTTISGSARELTGELYCNIGGTWHEIVESYIMKDGSWKSTT